MSANSPPGVDRASMRGELPPGHARWRLIQRVADRDFSERPVVASGELDLAPGQSVQVATRLATDR